MPLCLPHFRVSLGKPNSVADSHNLSNSFFCIAIFPTPIRHFRAGGGGVGGGACWGVAEDEELTGGARVQATRSRFTSSAGFTTPTRGVRYPPIERSNHPFPNFDLFSCGRFGNTPPTRKTACARGGSFGHPSFRPSLLIGRTSTPQRQ